LDLERSNLRDAVRWAAANGEATRLETAMDSMALLVLEGGDIGPGEWAQNALSSLGAELADVPNTSLAAAAGWALAMRVAECDAALRTLDRELTDPRLRSIMYLVMAHHNPPQAPRWTDAMLEAARDADDQLLVALARVRGLHADAITLADQHGNTSMRSTARLYTYATLPSADQPHSLHLVDECWRLALASNNQLALIQAGSARGTSLSRAGDVERGAPFLLDALERAVRRRATQLVWTVIEVVAGLLVIMEREPETSAVLWAAVDASDLTPFTRVIRDPDRPLWVEAQLSTADLDHARNIGRSLDMDAAASETRKAVERFAGS
jgi:hypothetical protein